MKFYLDEDLTPVIAVTLRTRGIDATSAHEVGRLGLSDAEQLAFAAGQGRCLCAANARDFRRLAHDAIDRGRPHAGIALCPPRVLAKRPVQATDVPTDRCDVQSVDQFGAAFGHAAPPSSYADAAAEGTDPGLVLWNSRLWIWDAKSEQFLQVGTVQGSMGGPTITPQVYNDPWPPGQSCYSMCLSGGGTHWQCWYYCGFLRNP